MGVVIAFGLVEEGEPSYEQFSYLYSVTKSKSADHGVPSSHKSWRNQRVLLSGDWESPSDRPVRFLIPTVFQIAGKMKQPTPIRANTQKVERVRSKVSVADRFYPDFLFTTNLIKARLIDLAESKLASHYRSVWAICLLLMLFLGGQLRERWIVFSRGEGEDLR
ncbi:unnamed protein product [Prunus armeniaca]